MADGRPTLPGSVEVEEPDAAGGVGVASRAGKSVVVTDLQDSDDGGAGRRKSATGTDGSTLRQSAMVDHERSVSKASVAMSEMSRHSISHASDQEGEEGGDQDAMNRRASRRASLESEVGTDTAGRRRSLRRGSKQQKKEKKGPTTDLMLKRMILPPEAFYGKWKRNLVNGDFRLMEHREEQFNFTYIDLFTREKISGPPTDMWKDKYIMVPRLLHCRSWIFQELYDHVDQDEQEGSHMLSLKERFTRTFGARINDKLLPGGMGLWSPVKYMAPMMFAVAFTADFTLMFIVFVAFVQCIQFGKLLNGWKYYKHPRLVTFPWRILVMGSYLVGSADIGTFIAEGKYIECAATIVCLICVAYDLIQGDLACLAGQEADTAYEVVRLLPGKVFVCKKVPNRFPAFSVSEPIAYPEELTGAEKNDEVILVAEVQGLLFELRPIETIAEWELALGHTRASRNTLEYYSTSTYNAQQPDASCFDQFGMPTYQANAWAGGGGRGSTSTSDSLRAMLEMERVQGMQKMESMTKSQQMNQLMKPAPKKGIGAMISRKTVAAFGGSSESDAANATELGRAKERTRDILMGVELMDRQINKIAQAEYGEVTKREMMEKKGLTSTQDGLIDPYSSD